MRGAGACNPRNEERETGILDLIVQGRLELTGHVCAVKLAANDSAIQFLPVGAPAHDVETIDLVALASPANDYLTANRDLRAIDLHIVLNLRVSRKRCHR